MTTIVKEYNDKEKKEAIKYLNEQSKTGLKEFNQTMTIRELIRWHQEEKIEIPWYQREGDLWPIKLRKQLIHNVFWGKHIPEFVFAEIDGTYYIIDGRQRDGVFLDLYNNKITLPLSIPKALGGGQLFKDADEIVQNRILDRSIRYTYLLNPTEHQCQDVFITLQQGVKLTPGEEIHGNYGQVKDILKNIEETHPILNYLDKKRFRYYKVFAALLMMESGKPVPITHDVLDYVNQGQEKEIVTQGVAQRFRSNLTKMKECCGGPYLTAMSEVRSIQVYYWLSHDTNIRSSPNKIKKFLNMYYSNMHVIHTINKSQSNVLFTEHALPYLTNHSMRRNTTVTLEHIYNHMTKEYQLFLEDKMPLYNLKSRNMCINR